MVHHHHLQCPLRPLPLSASSVAGTTMSSSKIRRCRTRRPSPNSSTISSGLSTIASSSSATWLDLAGARRRTRRVWGRIMFVTVTLAVPYRCSREPAWCEVCKLNLQIDATRSTRGANPLSLPRSSHCSGLCVSFFRSVRSYSSSCMVTSPNLVSSSSRKQPLPLELIYRLF